MRQSQTHHIADSVAQRRGSHRRNAHVHAQRALNVVALEVLCESRVLRLRRRRCARGFQMRVCRVRCDTVYKNHVYFTTIKCRVLQ